MQVQKIQYNNYIPQFNGLLKIHNLRKGGKITEYNTTQELDKGLADTALNNIFGGSWDNVGQKTLKGKKLAIYTEAINQTLGIPFRPIYGDVEKVELKHLNNGYSIKKDGDYKITHIREDLPIWD